MPLDDTSFRSTYSDPQAMLIVAAKAVCNHIGTIPGFIGEENNEMAEFWASTAINVFAERLSNFKISPEQIYYLSTCEVTTGHLDNYKGRIAVFATKAADNNIGQIEALTEDIGADAIRDSLVVTGGSKFNGRYNFPSVVKRMVAEDRAFDVIVVHSDGITSRKGSIYFKNEFRIHRVDTRQSLQRNAIVVAAKPLAARFLTYATS